MCKTCLVVVLSITLLTFSLGLKNLFAQHLYNSLLIEDREIDNLDMKPENSFDQLVPAVLISGFGNLVFKRSFMQRNGRLAFSYINEYAFR